MAFAGGNGACQSWEKTITQKKTTEGVVADQANRLAKNIREHMNDPHDWAEAAYKSPIPFAIFLESLFALSN